eukprot:g31613.t1
MPWQWAEWKEKKHVDFDEKRLSDQEQAGCQEARAYALGGVEASEVSIRRLPDIIVDTCIQSGFPKSRCIYI